MLERYFTIIINIRNVTKSSGFVPSIEQKSVLNTLFFTSLLTSNSFLFGSKDSLCPQYTFRNLLALTSDDYKFSLCPFYFLYHFFSIFFTSDL